VTITSATKIFGAGDSARGSTLTAQSFAVTGLLTYSRKYVAVQFGFAGGPVKEFPFGHWSYHYLKDQLVGDRYVKLPLLQLWIDDPNHEVPSALFEAHKAAIYSGRRCSHARFFKRRGDGVMTEKERADEWSSEHFFPLLGAYAWAEVQSPKLPRWAYPPDHEHFSLETVPTGSHMRRL
jgi:hypothetical protein